MADEKGRPGPGGRPEEKGPESGARRRFLGWAIGAITAAISVVYAVPLLSYLIKPSLKKSEEPWSEVCCLTGLEPGQPRSVTFQSYVKVGWEEKKVEHDAWLVKYEDGSINVFSPICPHLGCGYNWHAEMGRFVCPCHLSAFDIRGKVLGGPSPRPLDALPFKVEGTKLFVKYEMYRLGVARKVVA